MTPEEIVTHINERNRAILSTRDWQSLTADELLSLLDKAGMQGFAFGSNVALSMMQGALQVQLAKCVSAGGVK